MGIFLRVLTPNPSSTGKPSLLSRWRGFVFVENSWGMDIKKIYLHWSATPYTWKELGHYHTVVTGDGQVHRLTDYHTPLYAHTYARNQDAIAISLACMGNGGFRDYPPTEAQIDSMCKECAKVAIGLGWPADATKLKKLIMTHAECAANRDYPLETVMEAQGKGEAYACSIGLPHDNYGPSSWSDGWPGGNVERWDLWQLRPSDKGGAGGFELRDRIVAWMKKLHP